MYILVGKDGIIIEAYPNNARWNDGIITWNGQELFRTATPEKYRWIAVPEQEFCREGEDHRITNRYPDDVALFNQSEQALLIDRDTGSAIDEAIHPFAGIEEQIGILRAQIAEILVALGLEPTDEFAKLNAIAAEKIQEGQKKKEMLNDAKDS